MLTQYEAVKHDMQLVSTRNHSDTEVDVASRAANIYKNISIVNVTKQLTINFSLLKIKPSITSRSRRLFFMHQLTALTIRHGMFCIQSLNETKILRVERDDRCVLMIYPAELKSHLLYHIFMQRSLGS